MAGEILFLAHRTPFPPDRGDKIRSSNVLKALARLAPVHVGCLAETAEDLAQERELAGLAKSYWMPPRSTLLPLAGLSAILRKQAISEAAFFNDSLHQWVRRTLAEHPIDKIYVFSGQMGQYVPADWGGRLVVDFVDVDSAKFEAYAKSCRWPMSWINARENERLRMVEDRLAARADRSLLVSEEEAALLRERCPSAREVSALRNGIDCATFDPSLVEPHPEIAAAAGPQFVFSGQMDYAPNVAAVKRFARRIMPAILTHQPEARFHIVGRAPTKAVRNLASEPGTRVWGAVPDMRPFLAAADMVVAPLSIARGVQNKVLEAMAMGKTVLASPEALTGIDGKHGEHFLACRNNAEFAGFACALAEDMRDAHRIGAAARALVCETMSWPAMMAQLPEILGLASLPSAEAGPEEEPSSETRRDAA